MTFITYLHSTLKRPVMEHYTCATCPTRSLSPFHHLHGEEVEELCAHKRYGQFQKGDLLLEEGRNPRGVYCIQSGRVKMVHAGASGREHIVRFLTDGDLIGYRALLAGEPLTVSAVAMDKTAACFVPADVLLGFFQSNGPFSMEMLKQTCHELAEASRIMSSLAQKSVRERTAEFFLMLQARFGKDEQGCVAIDLKRSEWAELVGTATESLIRLLAELEDDGYIARVGKRFQIKDPHGLAEMARLED